MLAKIEAKTKELGELSPNAFYALHEKHREIFAEIHAALATGSALENLQDPRVVGPPGRQQHAVEADLADDRMAEAVGSGIAFMPVDEPPGVQAFQALPEFGLVVPGERRQKVERDIVADHRAELQQAALLVGKLCEAVGDQRLDVVRDRQCQAVNAAVLAAEAGIASLILDDQGRDLLEEQRIAAGLLNHRLRQFPAFEEPRILLGKKLSGIGVRQWSQAERLRRQRDAG